MDPILAGKGTTSTKALKHGELGVVRNRREQGGELGSGRGSDMIVEVAQGHIKTLFNHSRNFFF